MWLLIFVRLEILGIFQLDLEDYVVKDFGSNVLVHLTIIESTMPSKDKLFKIRRVIGECNKEIAMGERYKWPIRGGGTLIYLENEWLLDSFQLSYPTDVILEDKML